MVKSFSRHREWLDMVSRIDITIGAERIAATIPSWRVATQSVSNVTIMAIRMNNALKDDQLFTREALWKRRGTNVTDESVGQS